ncbi:VOC family protein [Austwickia chelonae]|uniref:VOC family protein n=1 Tax=Austwickia chelonae TaxID=100225 RepID=UPI000E22CA56|nr:VOC family protein [Austwickia chelonae]
MVGPVARFLDLWLDAHDVAVVGRFWASVLGMSSRATEDGAVRLSGDHAWDALWIRPVGPEATECCVHVDVSTRRLSTFLDLGAEVIDASSYPWVVLRGPEEAEICAFPQEPGSNHHIIDLVMDTADPVVAAQWWGEVLGTGYHASDDGDYAWVEPVPGAPFQSIVYARQQTPCPSSSRKLRPRLATHDVGALFSLGATRIAGARPGEILLTDPCGNEFFIEETELVIRPDDE